jgi:tripeptidyl-peptidase-1
LYSFAVDFYNSPEVPDVISLSWGWAEDGQCDLIDCTNITSSQYVDRVNREFLKLTLRGTTIVVASGDAGAPGRTNQACDSGRPINPIFPGSSPYVLSVGATYLEPDVLRRPFKSPLCSNNSCVTGTCEKSISYDKVGWTAGGGFNHYNQATPDWQRDAVQGYLQSGVVLPKSANFNAKGRAYPDVSAVGHSCPTVISGEITTVDGTSCSAPVLAGMLTHLNSFLINSGRPKLGFVNPLLYHLHSVCTDCFKDITEGHNWCTEYTCCQTNQTDFGFQATQGYDPVSGLGTLNLGNIITYLSSH